MQLGVWLSIYCNTTLHLAHVPCGLPTQCSCVTGAAVKVVPQGTQDYDCLYCMDSNPFDGQNINDADRCGTYRTLIEFDYICSAPCKTGLYRTKPADAKSCTKCECPPPPPLLSPHTRSLPRENRDLYSAILCARGSLVNTHLTCVLPSCLQAQNALQERHTKLRHASVPMMSRKIVCAKHARPGPAPKPTRRSHVRLHHGMPTNHTQRVLS